MQCYSELTPPTAVTHSLYLPFVSAESNNLIVAKTSLIQVFTTKSIAVEIDDTSAKKTRKESYDPTQEDDEKLETTFLGTEPIQRADRVRRTKLVLVAEYSLSGTITSLARIRTTSSKSGGDSLLIAFKDAKLSLVEWDTERQTISTVSIHYYEQDDLQGAPWTPRLGDCVNYLTADPGSRCAALKFGQRNLAILPFKQEDDDMHLDDWDEELDGPRPVNASAKDLTNGNGTKAETPYGSSFVLRLSALDSNLLHPIHLSFLHEYREPTFGILSSTLSTSSSLLHERKDQMVYMVFTLDLHQKASTTILSVGGLPYDLSKVVPVPAPVGGALLVGVNELIHIDQGGKANGIAVNMFARQCTSFNLVDLSSLDLRLEGCAIEQISNQTGEMLLILFDGSLAILDFQLDGRSVSGLSLRRVTIEAGGRALQAGASCLTSLGTNGIFVGSEVSDSVVLGWQKKSGQSTRRKSRLDLNIASAIDDEEEEEEEESDADDDLYGNTSSTLHKSADAISKAKGGDYNFVVHDKLVSIAPILETTFGQPSKLVEEHNTIIQGGLTSDLDFVASVGRDNAAALAVINRNIQPKIIGNFDFPEARGVWTLTAKRPALQGLETNREKSGTSSDYGADALYDRLMIVSKLLEDSSEVSDVYALTDAGFEALTGTEFEPAAGATIEANTLGNGMRIIQILTSEVRSYDGNLGLAQILPMFDDDTGAEPKIVSASFADPFVLLLRDDSSIYVARCDDDNELEEVEKEDDTLLAVKWLAGCLYKDSTGALTGTQNVASQTTRTEFMFLLSSTGALHIYALPDLSRAVFVAEGLTFVPPLLSPGYAARKSAAREAITEIAVADLGDEVSKQPFLILRTSNDDIIIYEPFISKSNSSTAPLATSLQFLKIPNPRVAENPVVAASETDDESAIHRNKPMRTISNLDGYSTVFMPGASPAFVIKSAKSSAKVLGLQGTGVRGLSSFHTAGCDRGFIYVDTAGTAHVAQFPPSTNFAELGVSLQKISLNETVHSVAFHPPMSCYVVSTSTRVPFELPKDDDHHRDWAKEDISFKPTMEQGYLKLINPVNWSIIDTITLDPFEIVLCVKVLNLEVSEATNERKQLITVGTGISKGEDLAIKGRIYVYDIVNVVPEPGRAETNKKLKLIAKEEIPRGAITGISSIGSQGFMLVSQGQKCMVRGLKEDGTLLPVAFLDMNCYLTVVKELPGTGICLLGDAVKGVWVAGYTEEPYKMMLFGKSIRSLEVTAGDFLPDGKELYAIVGDVDCNIHVLQFDPEHPKTQHGHFLLHRTTFSLGGHMPSTMSLLPRSSAPTEMDSPPLTSSGVIPQHRQILITTQSGSTGLLTPLTEAQYRSLNTLSTHLSNALTHHCGLNPKAYRIDRDAPESVGAGVSRTIVDGTILARWNELGSVRKGEIAGRMGADAEDVREAIADIVGWTGLSYL